MLAGFEHFHQLPLADKIRLVEEMWDDIAETSADELLDGGARAEIERRIADYEKEPTAVMTQDELWRRVEELRG